ncbi:MAG: single-stranded-DNA-specific exonuclease RecJ, partial [Alphaproteobacteria bacterium]|nr:single-stranded-DNA-specific exonuclease RecJ [Alphaproteobacteria bacterium]
MTQDLPLSVLGRMWQIPDVCPRRMMALQQQYNLNPLIAEIVLRRDIELESVASYLSPTIRDSMKDPMGLKDMDLAVKRVVSALDNNQKIMIYADYDVDGATSAALLKRYFRDLGHDVGVYIPDRIEEGYGANAQALSTIKDQGYDLVIMCDCGTTAFDALDHADEIGLDIIVLDHHTVEPQLPKCVALVNPHRLDQESTVRQEFGILCAAGVVFCFLAALNRCLRMQNKSDLPHLLNYLDLVALGTVCDVMPLKGMNRAFVTQGLKLMAMRQNVGLSKLMTVSGVDDKVSSYHLGFYLGPRINAGGRVGKASMGAELLSTQDPLYAQELAEKLNYYNEERKTIESIMLEQAYAKIEKEHLHDAPVIVVSGRDWHPGVIGIAASRIKERYNKPTIVIA